MFDIPGARERHQSARIPSSRINIEFMEIQDVPHKTIPLRIQDPGAATLVLIVRDLDARVAHIRQAGVWIATPGGEPAGSIDGSRAILIRDVDDRFIELRQPASEIPFGIMQPSNITEMRLSIAVADLDETMRLYRDVLGFKAEMVFGTGRRCRYRRGIMQ